MLSVRKLRLEHHWTYQQDNDRYILAVWAHVRICVVSIRVFIPAYRVRVVLEGTTTRWT